MDFLSSSCYFLFVCFLFHYVSAKFHLWPSSGDLARPRIGIMSLVTVSKWFLLKTITNCTFLYFRLCALSLAQCLIFSYSLSCSSVHLIKIYIHLLCDDYVLIQMKLIVTELCWWWGNSFNYIQLSLQPEQICLCKVPKTIPSTELNRFYCEF